MTNFQCRTCFKFSDLSTSSHLARKLLCGKTIKEILLFFIPEMITAPWIEELICSHCWKTLHLWDMFIKTCVKSEKLFSEQTKSNYPNKKLVENNNTSELIPMPVYQKRPSNCEQLQVQPAQVKQATEKTACDSSKATRKMCVPSDLVEEICVYELGDVNQAEHEPSDMVETTRCISSNAAEKLQKYCDRIAGLCESSDFAQATHQLSDTAKEKHSGARQKLCLLQDAVEENKMCSGCDEFLPLYCFSDLSAPFKCKNCALIEEVCISDFIEEDNEDDQNCLDDMVGWLPKANLVGTSANRLFKIHDRVLSISDINVVLPVLFTTLRRNQIKILQHGFPSIKKRLLLFGYRTMMCKECNYSCQTVENLIKHLKVNHKGTKLPLRESSQLYDDIIKAEGVTEKKSHICPVCKKNLYSVVSLERHRRTDHKDYKPFKCEKCGKSFKTKYTYRFHISQNSSDCRYQKCTVCSEKVKREDYTKHFKVHNTITCNKCGRSFASIKYLNMHRLKHERPRKKKVGHLCPVCGKMLSSSIAFSDHMKIHNNDYSKPYMCHVCAKTFLAKVALHSHITLYHKQGSVECPDCKRMCRTVETLRAHRRLKHSSGYRASCQICGQHFKRNDYFKRHMKHHTFLTSATMKGTINYKLQKEMTCKFCQKVVKNFATHLLTHVQNRKHKCSFCGMSFAYSTSLKRHLKRHEDPNYNLSCHICWYRPKTQEQLKEHCKTHEKSRKYKCQRCDASFSRKYLLGHHEAENHVTEEELEEKRRTMMTDALENDNTVLQGYYIQNSVK